jgi:elongation factor P
MMDSQTFEQFEFDEAFLRSAALFMKEGLEGIIIVWFEGFPIELKLPPIVELKVTAVSPPNDTTGGETLNATLETGATIAVPSYVKVGSTIQIDTRLGVYLDETRPR